MPPASSFGNEPTPRSILAGVEGAFPNGTPASHIDLEANLERARLLLAQSPTESVRLAQQTAQVAVENSDFELAAKAMRVQGQALRREGRHPEAIEAFATAAKHATIINDRLLAADVQVGTVDSLMMCGRLDEATELGHRLLAVFEEESSDIGAGRVHMNLGSVYLRRDRYHEALACYRKAERLLSSSVGPHMQAQMQVNCANALTHLNCIEDALTAYESARTSFQSCGDEADAAYVDTNEGFLHFVSGRYAQSLTHLTRAVHVLNGLGRDQEAARCEVDRAQAYAALNLWPEAEECCHRALEAFARHPLDFDRARAELVLALAMAVGGQTDLSQQYLVRAEATFRAQNNQLQLAHVQLLRAQLALDLGDTGTAKLEAHRAVQVYRKQKLGGWAAEGRFVLALADSAPGPVSVRRLMAISRAAREHRRGWLEARAEHTLGLGFAAKADFQRALRHLRNAVSVLEQTRTLLSNEDLHVSYVSGKEGMYEDLASVLLAGGTTRNTEEALHVAEKSKSRALFERVQAARVGVHQRDHDSAVRVELSKIRSQLSLYYQSQIATSGEPDQRKFVPSHLSFDVEHLERLYTRLLREVDLEDDLRKGLRSSILPRTREIQDALGEDEALLEYYSLGSRIIAFVVGKRQIEAVSVADASDVSNTTRRLRYQLHRCSTGKEFNHKLGAEDFKGIQEVLRDLYRLLIRPIQLNLNVGKLVIVPHGDLHGVPFHALLDGTEYSMDRWEHVYAPSASMWLTKSNLPSVSLSGTDTLLVGVPSPGIQDVATEIAGLTALLPGCRVLKGPEATRTAFFDRAPDCRILHIATHAHFRGDNPLFSGLQVGDGWLLARDLYDMRLACSLATLSACNTGVSLVGPGDELYGLVRGFLSAGASSVAASLWPADDTATSKLMCEFYAGMSTGLSKASSLSRAQKIVRDSYPNPYHWAAFVLVGGR